jgi:hypothetical protein
MSFARVGHHKKSTTKGTKDTKREGREHQRIVM